MDTLLPRLQTLLNDSSLQMIEQVQNLWSGYGQIVRIHSVATQRRYIVKVVIPTPTQSHPRGWGSVTSHQRKLRSYQVERCFYQQYAHLTDAHCQVPQLIAHDEWNGGVLLIMQDLNALGFTLRQEPSHWPRLKQAIGWLAHFHAVFMGIQTSGLWPIGTYWHLATRQEEFNHMPDGELKTQADAIDHALNSAQFQTLLHGDAKLANFCFHHDNSQLAAVDFQYTGRGSGTKDLAYLVGSALNQHDLQLYGEEALEVYLQQLKHALKIHKRPVQPDLLDAEIRQLYPIAWADFYRFLLGWNPNSWKINEYMKMMTKQGIRQARRMSDK